MNEWLLTRRSPIQHGWARALLGLLLAAATISAAHSAVPHPDVPLPADAWPTPIASTTDGPIVGFAREGLNHYLGIPYAAPPIGDLRWQPPARPRAWHEVFAATKFGPSCAQGMDLRPFADSSLSEDCLYLNVFSQEKAPSKPASRPVMVWIFGGGLNGGDSDSYDPTGLVRQGDVVVVTINYRLGALGYLALPSLYQDGKPIANYGFLDQQMALRWIQANIASFGGDPHNVTIFGESAGGRSVLFHLVAPGSAGLFQRAIVESGLAPPSTTMPSLAKSEAVSRAFAKAVGCPDADAACLRSRPIRDLMSQGDKPNLRPGATVDGTVLPDTIGNLIAQGKVNRVPVINGTNSNEYTWFFARSRELLGKPPLTPVDYNETLNSIFGQALSQKVRAEYALDRYPSPSDAISAAWGDEDMICAARRLDRSLAGQKVPVFAYEFADKAAPTYFDTVSFPYLAGHTQELQYLFRDYHGATGKVQPLTSGQRALSTSMIGYWTRFARHGRPEAKGAAAWPEYGASGSFIRFEQRSTTLLPDLVFAKEHHCAFWDAATARNEIGPR
ncbi:carboxylesterase/lipase family protein [Achromobacter aloeverae]